MKTYLYSIFCTLLAAVASAQTPVLYYNFDQTTGTNIVNLGSIATNGVLNGTAGDERWVTNGPPLGFTSGGALQLDGDGTATGDFVDTLIPANTVGMTAANYTASCWVNYGDLGGDKFVFGQTGAGWLHLGARAAKPHFGHNGADSQGPTTLVTNTWYHMTFVYDTGAQYIYINGVQDGLATVNRNLLNNNNLWIGRSINGNSAIPGLLDDILVYDVALRPNQVEHLAAGGDPLNLPAPDGGFSGILWTAPFGPGGTWNLYHAVTAPVANWWTAHTNAVALIDPAGGTGKPGHLVHPSNSAENGFIHEIAGFGDVYIGITDSEFFGGTEAGNNKTNGWVYATNGVDVAAAVSFFNWNGVEPNNAGAGEDIVHLRGTGEWNDQRSDIPGEGQNGGPSYKYVIEWETQSLTPVSNALVATTLLPADLPGPEGGDMFWSVVEVRDLGAIATINDAITNIVSGAGTRVTGQVDVINVVDASNYATGGFFQGNNDILSARNGDDQEVAALYKGRIRIPSAGDYTFGTFFDDGFALRIKGQEWRQTSGNVRRDAIASDLIYHVAGAGNARAVINLDAGDYDIEYISFERSGALHWELFAAAGAFLNQNDTTDWRLVGYKTSGEVGIPGLAGPWTVIMDDPGGTQITNLGIATNQIFTAATSTSQWDQLNFRDPDAGGNGSIAAGVTNFPNDVVGVGDDDFALGATNTLVIPVDGTYRFGFQGDDGGAIQLAGQTWDRVVQSATATGVVTGDLFLVDALTGNSRGMAEITLTAGQYGISAVFFERGGGAYYEMFYDTVTTQPVALLTNGPASTISGDIAGLQLVSPDPPQTGPVITEVVYAAGTVQLTWSSEASVSYLLEWTTDYSTWNRLEAGVGSDGARTTRTYPDAFSEPFVALRISEE